MRARHILFYRRLDLLCFTKLLRRKVHYALHTYNLVSKKGCPQRTHSMLETVNYYNFNKSNVFVLMLDASKAFDRVNYCKLFGELLKA